jgi:hypothetical protein
MSAIKPEQRFTEARPCPICRGHERLPRGEEHAGGSLRARRCFGFLSEDGKWAHCTRKEHAGDLARNGSSRTFAHKLYGSCKCGATHGEPVEGSTGAEWSPGGPVNAVYPYRDEDGRLLFEICRTATKEFRVRRPNPSKPNGFDWRLGDARKVLYRLPELIAAVAKGETIFIVEGEKDVDTLRKTGAAATCNPFGRASGTASTARR